MLVCMFVHVCICIYVYAVDCSVVWLEVEVNYNRERVIFRYASKYISKLWRLNIWIHNVRHENLRYCQLYVCAECIIMKS